MTILIDFAYFLSLKTKANPSPKGNGFAFNLFGDPYGRTVRFAPLGGFATANLPRFSSFRFFLRIHALLVIHCGKFVPMGHKKHPIH